MGNVVLPAQKIITLSNLKMNTMKKILILATTVCIMQSAFAQIKIDRSKRPTPGPAPVITIKEPAIFTLAMSRLT